MINIFFVYLYEFKEITPFFLNDYMPLLWDRNTYRSCETVLFSDNQHRRAISYKSLWFRVFYFSNMSLCILILIVLPITPCFRHSPPNLRPGIMSAHFITLSGFDSGVRGVGGRGVNRSPDNVCSPSLLPDLSLWPLARVRSPKASLHPSPPLAFGDN